ncbi:hypothetical protein WN51_13982 [Melipona quadrifasciata]|uniref:Uncharacterized protein n=1 Tax=Melipona quadrifasciata TaxID=166423 RepID=A0A0N0BFW3_9HYME|nr:hypothetical protein WN51_13982 [Melipona quadrifasciata]
MINGPTDETMRCHRAFDTSREWFTKNTMIQYRSKVWVGRLSSRLRFVQNLNLPTLKLCGAYICDPALVAFASQRHGPERPARSPGKHSALCGISTIERITRKMVGQKGNAWSDRKTRVVSKTGEYRFSGADRGKSRQEVFREALRFDLAHTPPIDQAEPLGPSNLPRHGLTINLQPAE